MDADIILRSAKVITVDDEFSIKESILGGEIVFDSINNC